MPLSRPTKSSLAVRTTAHFGKDLRSGVSVQMLVSRAGPHGVEESGPTVTSSPRLASRLSDFRYDTSSTSVARCELIVVFLCTLLGPSLDVNPICWPICINQSSQIYTFMILAELDRFDSLLVLGRKLDILIMT